MFLNLKKIVKYVFSNSCDVPVFFAEHKTAYRSPRDPI